jgi:uroporphyrinogen decarboxylase
MTKRETMQALLAGETLEVCPQWLMAFSSTGLARRLVPAGVWYDGYGEYPERDAYGFGPMGEERLRGEAAFNACIDRCAFPVGWGANAAFGHAGPGEINKRIVETKSEAMIVEYETGVRKEIRFKPHNVHLYGHPVASMADLDRLVLPDPDDPARYAGFAQDVAWAKAQGEWTVGWVNGFFSGVHYFLRDYAEFFMDLLAEPEFARAMTDRLGNWTVTVARRLCEAGVDCIGFCDDLGSGQSMLISPALYREFFLPWHRRLCETVHAFGAVVHMHSHGAILPVVGDLAAAGVDLLNPLDPDDQMPMAEVRQAVGPRVVLCGGMDKHFFDWPLDTQVEHLRKVLADGRRYGPHLLMDSGGIPDNVTRSGFDGFMAASQELRRRR